MSLPGGLLPLLDISVSEGELVQLGEQVVGDVLLVVVLRAEDELDSLRRRVCGDRSSFRTFGLKGECVQTRLWTDRMWGTPVRPLVPSGPVVSGDVCVLDGGGAAAGSPFPTGHGHRRTPPCDLTEET